MNTYNLVALDDKEFESLAVDLIGEEIGMRIERFKPGKDGGVDGRWFTTEKREAFVQCKHWIRSDFNALLRHLVKSELPKIARLQNAARYILVTSVELSRHNKKALCKKLAPYVRAESDIYGSEDIHDLLARHSQIERRHYKLWLTSSTAISHILNNAIIGRSAFNVTQILEKLPLIVKTDDFEKALALLNRRHSVIVTGVPGIGKTTLVEQLIVKLMADGYELLKLANDVSEAEGMFLPERKVVFYFDDFLGRNILEALAPHFDSHIVSFINRVRHDKSKRFLLTSRSNILNQAKHLTDLFDLEKVEKNEYEVRIEKLSRWDKARILYSHVWHSDLPHEILDELFKEKRYKVVVDHRNFNPRLVSFITDNDRAAFHGPSGYWNYVIDTLENPKGIWSNVFTAQLSQECRDLVYLVVFNGRPIAEADLRDAFRRTRGIIVGKEGKVEHDATVAAKICVGSVLSRTVNASTSHVEYDVFNPSIADYVYSAIEDWTAYRCFFAALRSNSSLRSLTHLRKAKFISDDSYRQILDAVAESEVERNNIEPDSYVVELAEMLVDDDGLRQKYAQLIEGVANGIQFSSCGDCYRNVMHLISACLRWDMLEAPIGRVTEMIGSLQYWPFDFDDGRMLAITVSELPVFGREAAEISAKQYLKGIWNDYVSEYVRDNDLLNEVYSEEHFPDARKELSDAVSETLKDSGFEFSSADVEEICNHVDLDRIAERNIERAENRSDEPFAPPAPKAETEDELIDDLFERFER